MKCQTLNSENNSLIFEVMFDRGESCVPGAQVRISSFSIRSTYPVYATATTAVC